MFRWIIYGVFLASSTCFGQANSIITLLDNSLNESSGLIHLNNRLITHLDSGGEAKLYEIDSTSGAVSRTVTVFPATNVDWEAICFDDTYIYIGDIGNNAGTRTNLGVYRISQAEYFSTPNDTVTAEWISFAYEDQTTFTPAVYSTNYDAEAFLALGDSLYIFTKNWGNAYTNVYSLPKTPGSYSANRADSVLVGAWITGASVNSAQDTIVFVGYSIQSSFLFRMTNFSLTDFSSGNTEYIPVPLAESYQTEAIARDGDSYLVTAEAHSSGEAALYRVKINSGVGLAAFSMQEAELVPNPASSEVTFPFDATDIQFFDLSGKPVLQSDQSIVNVSDLPRGMYVVNYSMIGKRITQRILLQ